MKINFYKYQGTGNDFVVIDDRAASFDLDDKKTIASICHRRTGVGADGLILLREHPDFDFQMIYYNSDGAPSSMCGNGGRCIVQFARQLGLITDKAHFLAVDGPHRASLEQDLISLQMSDVSEVERHESHVFLDTGSPHHVAWVVDVDHFPVVVNGRKIRNQLYGSDGANANFVQQLSNNKAKVRTYERGVEDETLSCGTGVTAVAIAMHATGKTTDLSVDLITPGGVLNVRFEYTESGYQDVWLTGPAQLVFKGTWS